MKLASVNEKLIYLLIKNAKGNFVYRFNWHLKWIKRVWFWLQQMWNDFECRFLIKIPELSVHYYYLLGCCWVRCCNIQCTKCYNTERSSKQTSERVEWMDRQVGLNSPAASLQRLYDAASLLRFSAAKLKWHVDK